MTRHRTDHIVSYPLTRRGFWRLTGAGSVAVLLAACGGDGDDAEPTATSGSASSGSTQPTATSAAPSTSGTAAASATTATVATPQTSAGQGKPGGTLRIATNGDWRVLDPPIYANITDRNVFYAIYDPLVTMNESLDLEPFLARSWEVSSDALTWTFTLQSGVKFHDGTDFNAEAAKFNLERILDAETGSRLRQELTAIQEVRAPNATTLEVVLQQPFTPLLSWLSDVPGMQPSPAAIEQWGEEFANHPVGTGPFEFVSQTKGSELRLRRFEDYWLADRTFLDQVVYQPIPDPSVKLAGLRSGSVDLVDSVPPQQVETLRSDPNIKLAVMEGTFWPLIRMNLKVAPFDNKAIRQALNLAVNRDAIIRAVYFGNATPCFGPLSPIYGSVFDPNIESYALKYDLAKAKQKLAEGGQPNGFTFTLDINGGVPEDVRMAEILKANWAEIGITAEIVPHDGNAAFDKVREGDYQTSLGSFTPRPDPDGTMRRHFHSESTLNYMFYGNPQVDELLDLEQRLPHGDERTKAFRDMQRIIVDDAPWIFLVFVNTVFGMAKSVEGLPIIPDTLFRPGPVWLNK